MKLLSYPTLLSLALGSSLLVACGGDPQVAAAPPTQASADPLLVGTGVPTSATTSAAGAMAFVKSVANTTDETAEPIELGNAVLVQSDTDEPDASV